MNRHLLPALLALGACYQATYSPRVPHRAHRVDPKSIEILASNDSSRDGWIEIGIISAGGSSYDEALERAKARAAEEGCDAMAVVDVAVQGATGASWTGPIGQQELRIACLIVDETPKPKPKPKKPTPATPPACNPSCRDGYDCAFGECYPACNPPCADGEECTGHGTDAKCHAK